MIGPFDFWTTFRLGSSAGAAGAVPAFPAGSWGEHWASSVPADTASTLPIICLRVRTAGPSLLGEVGPHVPHPVEWQPPHAPPPLPITLSDFSMIPSSRHLCFA